MLETSPHLVFLWPARIILNSPHKAPSQLRSESGALKISLVVEKAAGFTSQIMLCPASPSIFKLSSLTLAISKEIRQFPGVLRLAPRTLKANEN